MSISDLRVGMMSSLVLDFQGIEDAFDLEDVLFGRK
jgi:hypothetical protein